MSLLDSFATSVGTSSDFLLEKVRLGLVLWGVYEVVFIVSNVLFILISKIPSLQRYKVQPTRFNSLSDWWTIAKRVLALQCVIILPLSLMLAFVLESTAPFPGWPRAFANFAFTFLLDDFLLYWLHRISHWPQFYRFHKLHHDYLDPFGMVSAYLDPLELTLICMASGAGAHLCGSSPIEIMFIVGFRSYLDVEHHCGYAYPWSVQNWLPGFIGSHFHDFHHEAFVRKRIQIHHPNFGNPSLTQSWPKTGNYGISLYIWDILFGTVNPKYWRRWDEFAASLKGTPKTQ